MSEGTHINVNFLSKYETQLKGIWNNIDNEAGSEGKIDKNEETQNVSSIYFVEEGMTEAQFIEKNLDVAASEMLALPSDYNGTKTQYAVSQIVNEMLDKIDRGEFNFEAKKDVILGKMKFLDEETKDRVEQYLRFETTGVDEEQPQRPKSVVIDLPAGKFGFTKGGKTTLHSDGSMSQGAEIRSKDGTIYDYSGRELRKSDDSVEDFMNLLGHLISRDE